jgi:hypothetical protein
LRHADVRARSAVTAAAAVIAAGGARVSLRSVALAALRACVLVGCGRLATGPRTRELRDLLDVADRTVELRPAAGDGRAGSTVRGAWAFLVSGWLPTWVVARLTPLLDAFRAQRRATVVVRLALDVEPRSHQGEVVWSVPLVGRGSTAYLGELHEPAAAPDHVGGGTR